MKKIILLLQLVISMLSFSYEKIEDLKNSMMFERDVPIKMRDGKTLYANVFSPLKDGKFPVLVSMGPYGKDILPGEYEPSDGIITTSEYTAFEVIDPVKWTAEDYIVINVDSRGTWDSEGDISVFSKQEAEDYYDIIEWAGVQPWSNGNVGTSGVSYFAISQWNVAALNPPHLKAIMPWEGFTDFYRDALYHGGVEEKGFIRMWYSKVTGNKRKGSNPEDLIGEVQENLTYNDFYKDRAPNLSDITVPTFVGASWSDHGLHTRGTLEGFKEISSEDTWLYIHGLKKWEVFYSEESFKEQKRFFDYYLKNKENDMKSIPKVRYALRDSFYNETYEASESYPLSNIEYTELYLDGKIGSLNFEKVSSPSKAIASSDTRFNYTFEKDTKLVGGMTLTTYISISKGDDADIFVGVDKLDSKGNKVHFQGNDTEIGHLAMGWLKVSQREVDLSKTTKDRLYLTHGKVDKIEVGDI